MPVDGKSDTSQRQRSFVRLNIQYQFQLEGTIFYKTKLIFGEASQVTILSKLVVIINICIKTIISNQMSIYKLCCFVSVVCITFLLCYRTWYFWVNIVTVYNVTARAAAAFTQDHRPCRGLGWLATSRCDRPGGTHSETRALLAR